jgi:putative transposase
VITEAAGGPLGVVLAAANVPDLQLLAATLEAIIVPRPTPTAECPQHLCLDKGYDAIAGDEVVTQYGYIGHIRRKREATVPREQRTYPPHRWVVERTLAWLSKCRSILVRYAKKAENYLAFIQLACILLWYRRLDRLTILR